MPPAPPQPLQHTAINTHTISTSAPSSTCPTSKHHLHPCPQHHTKHTTLSTACRLLQQQKEEQHAAEFSSLQEQGLNPYEEHRRRDNESVAARQAHAVQVSIARRKSQLEQQVAKEEAQLAAAAAKQERQRAEAERCNAERSSAAELRNERYLKSHTLEGATILDPTGGRWWWWWCWC
jgi:hypothetical protein